MVSLNYAVKMVDQREVSPADKKKKKKPLIINLIVFIIGLLGDVLDVKKYKQIVFGLKQTMKMKLT